MKKIPTNATTAKARATEIIEGDSSRMKLLEFRVLGAQGLAIGPKTGSIIDPDWRPNLYPDGIDMPIYVDDIYTPFPGVELTDPTLLRAQLIVRREGGVVEAYTYFQKTLNKK